MSHAEKRLKRVMSTISRISTFSVDTSNYSTTSSVFPTQQSSLELSAAISDHALKTNYLTYQRRALSKLNENRTYANIARNIVKISANQLFNLLNQETLQNYPKLSDPNFLLILDTRSAEEFNEGHIVTARHIERIDGEFQPLYGWDLECKQNLVVYDTYSLAADSTSKAFQCALLLYNTGSRHPVKILNGGYADFCKFYPDYNTIQILYTPKELDEYPTYPNEIIPGKLYLGRLHHAQAPFVHKELKIKAHVNCDVVSMT
uniref:Rhodanese domain-containing protein n=1 Tax=Strigamia maritima TaxID=126957 RepID=T1J6F5_STRMM